MNRKIAIWLLTAFLLTNASLAEAQQAGKIPRIGYLNRGAGPGEASEAFLNGLRDLGWIEGKNIAIEYRWAEYKMDRYLRGRNYVIRRR